MARMSNFVFYKTMRVVIYSSQLISVLYQFDVWNVQVSYHQ